MAHGYLHRYSRSAHGRVALRMKCINGLTKPHVRAWQVERKEGEGSNLVIGALAGSVALSIPFYWKNVARLGACGACHRLPLLRHLSRC